MKKIIRLTESDLHRLVKESVRKVIREANIYPGYDSTTTGEVGQAKKPKYSAAKEINDFDSRKPGDFSPKEQAFFDSVDAARKERAAEHTRLQGTMDNIYKDMGLPNGPKGDGDKFITSDNNLASKKEVMSAFRHFWIDRAKRRPEGLIQEYDRYKNDPMKIYDWFKSNGIDYKDYL